MRDTSGTRGRVHTTYGRNNQEATLYQHAFLEGNNPRVTYSRRLRDRYLFCQNVPSGGRTSSHHHCLDWLQEVSKDGQNKRDVSKTKMSKRQEKCRDRKKKRETRNAKNPLLLHLFLLLLLPLVLYLCRSNRDNTPPPPASLLHPPFPTFTALVVKESQESMHLLQRCREVRIRLVLSSKGDMGMFRVKSLSRLILRLLKLELCVVYKILSLRDFFFPFCLYYCISYSVHSPPVLLCWTTTTVKTSDIFKDLRFS